MRTIKKDTLSLSKCKITADDKPFVPLRKWWCPVCKKEYSYIGLELTGEGFGEYAGNYCMICMAKWINGRFPKLEEIKNEDKR